MVQCDDKRHVLVPEGGAGNKAAGEHQDLVSVLWECFVELVVEEGAEIAVADIEV